MVYFSQTLQKLDVLNMLFNYVLGDRSIHPETDIPINASSHSSQVCCTVGCCGTDDNA